MLRRKCLAKRLFNGIGCARCTSGSLRPQEKCLAQMCEGSSCSWTAIKVISITHTHTLMNRLEIRRRVEIIECNQLWRFLVDRWAVNIEIKLYHDIKTLIEFCNCSQQVNFCSICVNLIDLLRLQWHKGLAASGPDYEHTSKLQWTDLKWQ